MIAASVRRLVGPGLRPSEPRKAPAAAQSPIGRRIVVVSHSHPRLRAGGGEVAAYRHFRHLQRSGEDVYFVGCTVGDDGTRLMGRCSRCCSSRSATSACAATA